jgi:hypothetical protein
MMCRECALPKWLRSHMSMLGRCWVQAYFEKEVYVGHRAILRRKSILGTCLFLEKDLFWERPFFGEGSVLGKIYFWKGRPNFGARTIGVMNQNSENIINYRSTHHVQNVNMENNSNIDKLHNTSLKNKLTPSK